jgi:DNA adenine methylase
MEEGGAVSLAEQTPSRPVLRWHGAKWRLAPWIISHMPKHRVYVEPFGGGASVLLRKPRCNTEIYNDRDGDVVNLFRVLRTRPGDLALALALTPYARDEYDALYAPGGDDLERARALVARSFMGMNSKGALEKSGFDTRVNPDSFIARLRSLAAIPDELAAVAARLTHVVIENDNAVSLLSRHDRPDALFYLDPPYVLQARSGAYYRHEMSDADHAALLDAATGLTGMVMISGYASDLYDDRLAGWRRLTLDARTDGNAERVEVLWLNDATCAALDDRRHALAGGHGTPLFTSAEGRKPDRASAVVGRPSAASAAGAASEGQS